MRLLSLSLAAFGSYAEPTAIDFAALGSGLRRLRLRRLRLRRPPSKACLFSASAA